MGTSMARARAPDNTNRDRNPNINLEEDDDSDPESPGQPAETSPKCVCVGEIGHGLTFTEIYMRTPDEYNVLQIQRDDECPLSILNPDYTPPDTPYDYTPSDTPSNSPPTTPS